MIFQNVHNTIVVDFLIFKNHLRSKKAYFIRQTDESFHGQGRAIFKENSKKCKIEIKKDSYSHLKKQEDFQTRRIRVM